MPGPQPAGTGGAGTVTGQTTTIPTSGPVTPEEIYLLLLQAGYSTAQAVGIMANAIAESSLSPEAHNPKDPTSTCPGAQSFGLLQWNTCSYPNAANLVTGNPQSDIRAQIQFLGSNVSQSAIAGASGTAVAGNFAQYFERCASCQPGGAEYAQRVANAATVLGWLSSGSWPSSSGAIQGGGAAGGTTNACLINFPGVLGIGSGCIFSTSQARALLGGALLAVALPVGLTGAVILAAFAFRRTGAGSAIGRAAEAVGGGIALVPGAQGAGAAVAAAGSAEARSSQRRQVEQRQKRDDAQARHDEAEYKRYARRSQSASSTRAPVVLDPVPF